MLTYAPCPVESRSVSGYSGTSVDVFFESRRRWPGGSMARFKNGLVGSLLHAAPVRLAFRRGLWRPCGWCLYTSRRCACMHMRHHGTERAASQNRLTAFRSRAQASRLFSFRTAQLSRLPVNRQAARTAARRSSIPTAARTRRRPPGQPAFCGKRTDDTRRRIRLGPAAQAMRG